MLLVKIEIAARGFKTKTFVTRILSLTASQREHPTFCA